MLRLLFLILLCIAHPVSAQEVVVSYDSSSLPVLNEELRQSSASIRSAKSLISELQADVKALQDEAFPQGIIAMWSGTIASIPDGWEPCDGGTYAKADGSGNFTAPDLRDRFIVGATSDDGGVAKTNVTGSLTQSGDGQIPAHTHSYSTPNGQFTEFGKVLSDGQEALSSTTGSYGTGTKNIAVYFALAFIIKT
jgi:hypothetical protein